MQSVKGEMKAPGSCLDQWTCVRERWMHKEPVAICSCLGSMEHKLRLGRGMRTEEEGSLGQRGSWIDGGVGMTRTSAGPACVWW